MHSPVNACSQNPTYALGELGHNHALVLDVLQVVRVADLRAHVAAAQVHAAAPHAAALRALLEVLDRAHSRDLAVHLAAQLQGGAHRVLAPQLGVDGAPHRVLGGERRHVAQDEEACTHNDPVKRKADGT